MSMDGLLFPGAPLRVVLGVSRSRVLPLRLAYEADEQVRVVASCASAGEALAVLERGDADGAILDEDLHGLDRARLGALKERRWRLVLLSRQSESARWEGLPGAVLHPESDPIDILHALQPAPRSQFTRLRPSHSTPTRPTPRPCPSANADQPVATVQSEPLLSSARVIGFWGGRGSAGKTTLACNSLVLGGAVEPTVLVELETTAASLAAYLDNGRDGRPRRARSTLLDLASSQLSTPVDWERALAQTLQSLGSYSPHARLLCGIAHPDEIGARLLGDPDQSGEIFQLNRGAQAPDGHVLLDPNLIWPGLRLRLPRDGKAAPPAESAPVPTPAVAPEMAAEPDRQDQGPAQEARATPVITAPPAASPTTASTPAPETAAPVQASPAPTMQAPPTIQPVAQVRTDSSHPVSPAAAALGAAGLAAAALAAGRLVVPKRKPGRDPDGPESDVSIQDGFAEVDPVEDLARRLARTSGPASAIASLLGQAYAAMFDELLEPDERHEVRGVTVAATRHGRTSTTLVLAAPVAARPHFVHTMRAAAERAFGEHVDVDGKVDQDGDVLVRVNWDPRYPIAGDLLECVHASAVPSAWPAPCLVPALALYDRQHLAINWHTLGNLLVAAPTGQGADVPLAALVAALASVRAPEDLGLVVVARPHTLPDEIGVLPHVLLDVADPGDPEGVQHALESVKHEIDRRRQSGPSGDADVVVVVRELGDLEPEAMAACAAIAATGPEHGVRLVAASERPVAELLRSCPFVDQLGTRLVLQTASEEDSVALLGMDGAERLGAGGHALLRFEGRTPYPGWAHRVSADRLARLVHMMGTRAPAVPAAADEPVAAPPDEPVDAQGPEEIADSGVADPAGEDVEETAVSGARMAQNKRARPPATPTWASPLLRELRAAPIRVRCFGACDVWHGDRLLKIGDPELLLLLAVHPVTGINGETVADMLWDDIPDDLPGALRKERSKLRLNLRRLVPDLPADPLPGTAYHGEKVVALDSSVVSSDVHEFTELLKYAEKLDPPAAIEAYEAALALYQGDLLDSADMRNYRWMYNADPQIGLMRRSDLRRQHKEARLKLAGLLAEGPESGLARAEELYAGLCGEDLENEHLWTALFRIHERTGSSLGLESAVRRLRGAQIELGTTDVTDIDRVPLPPNLDRLVQRIRQRIGSNPVEPAAGGDSK